ncbi:hypothetical protein SD70_02645 [Gordoniibacillus kamchatkensis]|uniref:Uncharacterized protein n=1 Tax=Gordoniibacillus kamchatkensis TaxID=1590651 RepID=A0ABR5AM83_9BACL|nr:hypothetical protein [Paenibacillus sp. VKM B-2647]KIL42099.1 hypothetical protein SD70_02645 [Paenibacillus sp. VKM B-2647]
MNPSVQEIREALQKATPGPWYAYGTEVFVESGAICKLWGERPGGEFKFDNYENNAHLIANAPEWLKWQNEKIESLQ